MVAKAMATDGAIADRRLYEKFQCGLAYSGEDRAVISRRDL